MNEFSRAKAQPAHRLVQLRPYLSPDKLKKALVITLNIESEADLLRKAWRGWSRYREIYRDQQFSPLQIHASQVEDRITEHFEWTVLRFSVPPRIIDTGTMTIIPGSIEAQYESEVDEN